MNLPILKIQNLRFAYAQHEILNVNDFQIEAEEMVFLFGPSGSGKSTLLELISGILKPQNGHLFVCEKDLSQMSLAELDHFRAENIGYIFQNFNLVPYLTVLENIVLPFLFQKTNYDQSLLDQLVQKLGLKDLKFRNVLQLSVGQQQRVAVARALLKKPKLILADEPTSALDYDHREIFLKMLFDLCRLQKTTVLFVSHDRSIEKLFDRSVNLKTINQVEMTNEKESL